MSYCVNCGVKLAPSEKKCPLCGVEVQNPKAPFDENVKRPFPAHSIRDEQKISWRSIWSLLTLIFLIPIGLVLACDVNITHGITWSKYVVSSLLLLYVLVIVPVIMSNCKKKWRPVLSTAIAFLAMAMHLLAIERFTGGSWFLNFAMPVVIGAAVCIIIVELLRIYGKFSRLATVASVAMAIGIMCVVIEGFLNYAFGLRDRLAWSLYPLITFVIIGIILFVADGNPLMKERLRRMFFI